MLVSNTDLESRHDWNRWVSYDLASLKGKRSAVATAFEIMSNTKPSPVFEYIFLLAHLFPVILKLPSPRTKLSKMLNDSTSAISSQLFAKAKIGEGRGPSRGTPGQVHHRSSE